MAVVHALPMTHPGDNGIFNRFGKRLFRKSLSPQRAANRSNKCDMVQVYRRPPLRQHTLPIPGTDVLSEKVTIEQLRQTLIVLDSRILNLATQKSKVEAQLASAVAQQCPIRNLPREVLAFIFAIGVQEMHDEDPLFLARLTLVCRHWYQVAVDTGELWSRVVIGNHDGLEKARRNIERSKGVPLDVTISYSPRSPPHSDSIGDSLQQAMGIVVPHMARWRSFRLRVPYRPNAHAAVALLTERAPFLEEFSLQVHHSMQDSSSDPPLPSRPLFRGHTPRLRSCSFTSFHLGWDATQPGPALFRGLRVLKLANLWADHAPSGSQLLAILRASPLLEELVLRNISDIDAEPDACTPTIMLPLLRRASFYYSGLVRTCAVLSSISFPALQELELSYLDNITVVFKELKRQAHAPPEPTIMPSAGGATSTQGGLHLRSLRVESSLFNELKLMRLLRLLPSITTLELVDVEDVSPNLLRGLSTPPTAHDWILPRLESLSLDGCTAVDWDALRTLIDARVAHARGVGDETVPRQIRSLDLSHCSQISREMVQYLRMYVPDVRSETGRGPWAEAV